MVLLKATGNWVCLVLFFGRYGCWGKYSPTLLFVCSNLFYFFYKKTYMLETTVPTIVSVFSLFPVFIFIIPFSPGTAAYEPFSFFLSPLYPVLGSVPMTLVLGLREPICKKRGPLPEPFFFFF